jgi:WD40 repeat protein
LQQDGFSCASVDITNIGSETVTAAQWYKGIAAELWRGFNLLGKVNFKEWWQDRAGLSPVQQLSQFIEDILLVEVPGEKIFIFIDEIDSVLSLDFPLDDFFALIRYCYNQRADNPIYSRLTFALFGVATPSDLIRDRSRTPFNLGRAIELNGFQLAEATPLSLGLATVVSQPQTILAEILDWTGGQPFLTQKLCRLVVQSARGSSVPSIADLVRDRIITNWQSQDEPEHLKTIRARLLRNERQAGALLGIYQQILEQGNIAADDSPLQSELLLSGLIVKSAGMLVVRNAICQAIFDCAWVEKQLANLRPYGEALQGWLNSNYQDPSRLLQGRALKDARTWSRGKNLSQLDYQFLAASEELDRQEVQQALEAERAKESEARLAEQTKRLKLQRLLLLVVSIAFLIATDLGIIATLREIEAIATTSDSLFASNKRLESLVKAIEAKKRLNNLHKIGSLVPQTEAKVRTSLLQAVYGANEYNRLPGNSAAFQPNGSLVATQSDGIIELRKPDGKLEKKIGNYATFWGVVFSPDGRLLASAIEGNTVRIWKLDSTEIATLKGHKNTLRAVAFSPDGQLIATSSDDGIIKLWKLDGTELATLDVHKAQVGGIAFSPDGQLLASTDNKSIRVWTVRNNRVVPLQLLVGHQDYLSSVAFSPDSRLLASASADKTIKLWRRNRLGQFETQPAKTFIGHEAGVSKAVFSPDGRTLASVSWDTTVKLWNLDGATLQTLRGHTQRAWGVSFSPDSQQLATASEDNKGIRLWHLQNPFSVTLNDHKAEVRTVAFSPDGQILASGSDDQTIKLWQQDGTPVATLRGHKGGILSVAFSPDRQMLASSSWNKTVKLWQLDPRSGQYTLRQDLSGCGLNWQVAFSADGQRLASTCGDAIKVWTKNGRLLKFLKHSKEARSVAFSPDNSLIASVSMDKTLKLWRQDGTLVKTLIPSSKGLSTTVFSPDSGFVAAGGLDNNITIWSLRDLGGNPIKLKGHSSEVRSIAFSPDSKLVASASTDQTIKIWKTDGTELVTLKGHTNAVWNVAFSPDGQKLVSSSEDRTIKLWNLNLVLHPEKAFSQGCNWVRDYLKHSPDVSDRDRRLCD